MKKINIIKLLAGVVIMILVVTALRNYISDKYRIDTEDIAFSTSIEGSVNTTPSPTPTTIPTPTTTPTPTPRPVLSESPNENNHATMSPEQRAEVSKTLNCIIGYVISRNPFVVQGTGFGVETFLVNGNTTRFIIQDPFNGEDRGLMYYGTHQLLDKYVRNESGVNITYMLMGPVPSGWIESRPVEKSMPKPTVKPELVPFEEYKSDKDYICTEIDSDLYTQGNKTFKFNNNAVSGGIGNNSTPYYPIDFVTVFGAVMTNEGVEYNGNMFKIPENSRVVGNVTYVPYTYFTSFCDEVIMLQGGWHVVFKLNK
jgi:hypothetical protein